MTMMNSADASVVDGSTTQVPPEAPQPEAHADWDAATWDAESEAVLRAEMEAEWSADYAEWQAELYVEVEKALLPLTAGRHVGAAEHA